MIALRFSSFQFSQWNEVLPSKNDNWCRHCSFANKTKTMAKNYIAANRTSCGGRKERNATQNESNSLSVSDSMSAKRLFWSQNENKLVVKYLAMFLFTRVALTQFSFGHQSKIIIRLSIIKPFITNDLINGLAIAQPVMSTFQTECIEPWHLHLNLIPSSFFVTPAFSTMVSLLQLNEVANACSSHWWMMLDTYFVELTSKQNDGYLDLWMRKAIWE